MGGMELATYHLANSLNKYPGIKACVACAPLSDVPRNYEYNFPVYRALRASFLSKNMYSRNISNMIHSEKINILHGQSLQVGGLWAMKYSQKTGLPFLVTSHGSDVQIVPEIGYGARLKPEINDIMKKVVDKAMHIIAVSKQNKSDLIELGASAEKITVIPNGIQFKEIQNIAKVNFRNKIGLDENDFVIITVGRNRPVKRMELLFEAIQRTNNIRIKCIIVGPIENNMKLVENYGLSKQIINLENIPKEPFQEFPPYTKLIQAYHAADVYISTSYVESFGMAAADALACGKYIIIGRKHGIGDWLNSINGIQMKEDTPQELAKILNKLFENVGMFRKNETSIRDSVKIYTWENIAMETIKIYQNII
jgi:glycosyltransferase involved in cell wall biosynthesis